MSSIPDEPGRHPEPEPTQPPPAAPTPPDLTVPAGPDAPPTSQTAPAYPPPPPPQYQNPTPGQPPAPAYTGQVLAMSESDERMWGMFAQLSPFVTALVGLPFLGPLVIFLIYKDRSPFVRRHALESLNFQLTLLIGYLISAMLFLVIVGIFTAIAIAITSIVLQILAAIAANRGDDYRYPLTIRFVH